MYVGNSDALRDLGSAWAAAGAIFSVAVSTDSQSETFVGVLAPGRV
jgi:hypothetical protein